jgi:hypothetical protein
MVRRAEGSLLVELQDPIPSITDAAVLRTDDPGLVTERFFLSIPPRPNIAEVPPDLGVTSHKTSSSL